MDAAVQCGSVCAFMQQVTTAGLCRLLLCLLCGKRTWLLLLQVTDDITDLSEADLFSEVGKRVSSNHMQTRAVGS